MSRVYVHTYCFQSFYCNRDFKLVHFDSKCDVSERGNGDRAILLPSGTLQRQQESEARVDRRVDILFVVLNFSCSDGAASK